MMVLGLLTPHPLQLRKEESKGLSQNLSSDTSNLDPFLQSPQSDQAFQKLMRETGRNDLRSSSVFSK